MHEEKLVSIVTPSYNQGRFIEDTILSIKNQTYPNIEHIIIDGGSTDNTLGILKKYKDTYNMQWISEPDNGPADAINKGFAMAQGSIYGYLNSDDKLLAESISLVVTEFDQNQDIDIIYGNAYIINQYDQIIRKMYSASFFNRYLYVLGGFCIAQQAAFWRRDIFEKVEGFNPDNRISWDGEFWVDVEMREGKFKYINKFLGKFRHHPDSITRNKKFKPIWIDEREKIFKKVFGRHSNFLDRKVLGAITKMVGKFFPPQRLTSKINKDIRFILNHTICKK